LQNTRWERTLIANDKYRILSYGDPVEVAEYRDALGRSWITATWLIGFDDAVLILYILPLPDGPTVISTYKASSRRQIYEWDLRKLCDHIHTAYLASFEGWDEFIALNANFSSANFSSTNLQSDEAPVRYIPDFLGDFKFDWKPDAQEVSIEAGTFSISADNAVFEWNPLSELFITPCWYQTEDLGPADQGPAEQVPIEFGVRRINLSQDFRDREYINLYKNIKPDPRRGASAAENWNDLVQAKYPYDEKPRISANDNTGFVGAMLQAETPNPDVLYTLYLFMEDPQDEENLSSRFSALKAGTRIQR
jgi:hypothetical protein